MSNKANTFKESPQFGLEPVFFFFLGDIAHTGTQDLDFHEMGWDGNNHIISEGFTDVRIDLKLNLTRAALWIRTF